MTLEQAVIVAQIIISAVLAVVTVRQATITDKLTREFHQHNLNTDQTVYRLGRLRELVINIYSEIRGYRYLRDINGSISPDDRSRFIATLRSAIVEAAAITLVMENEQLEKQFALFERAVQDFGFGNDFKDVNRLEVSTEGILQFIYGQLSVLGVPGKHYELRTWSKNLPTWQSTE